MKIKDASLQLINTAKPIYQIRIVCIAIIPGMVLNKQPYAGVGMLGKGRNDFADEGLHRFKWRPQGQLAISRNLKNRKKKWRPRNK